MADGGFFVLALIFIVITLLAFIAKLFRQPFIPFYIVTGVLLLPIYHLISPIIPWDALGLLTNEALITSISQFGIIFLLFIVGLELDFKRLKHVSSVSMVGGSVLVILLFFIGLGIAVFVFNIPEAYKMLGIMYATLGAVRAVSMVIDKSIEQSNIISLIAEIVLAVILVWSP